MDEWTGRWVGGCMNEWVNALVKLWTIRSFFHCSLTMLLWSGSKKMRCPCVEVCDLQHDTNELGLQYCDRNSFKCPPSSVQMLVCTIGSTFCNHSSFPKGITAASCFPQTLVCNEMESELPSFKSGSVMTMTGMLCGFRSWARGSNSNCSWLSWYSGS